MFDGALRIACSTDNIIVSSNTKLSIGGHHTWSCAIAVCIENLRGSNISFLLFRLTPFASTIFQYCLATWLRSAFSTMCNSPRFCLFFFSFPMLFIVISNAWNASSSSPFRDVNAFLYSLFLCRTNWSSVLFQNALYLLGGRYLAYSHGLTIMLFTCAYILPSCFCCLRYWLFVSDVLFFSCITLWSRTCVC